jgi:hypothetical protein
MMHSHLMYGRHLHLLTAALRARRLAVDRQNMMTLGDQGFKRRTEKSGVPMKMIFSG